MISTLHYTTLNINWTIPNRTRRTIIIMRWL